MKSLGPKSLVAGTVRVNLSADRTQLIGTCPTCNSRLSVELRSDGSFGNLVACMRCKEIYRVESKEALEAPPKRPQGFGVAYVVDGMWDVASIMESLFDTIGAVTTSHDGFVCHPDAQHPDFPSISVDERARTVRFNLFGNYLESEAGSIINQVASEFGIRFRVELRPLLFERWECRDAAEGLTLVEQRPLGTLLRERVRRQARS